MFLNPFSPSQYANPPTCNLSSPQNKLLGYENRANDYTQQFICTWWKIKFSKPIYNETIETVKESSAIQHMVFGAERVEQDSTINMFTATRNPMTNYPRKVFNSFSRRAVQFDFHHSYLHIRASALWRWAAVWSALICCCWSACCLAKTYVMENSWLSKIAKQVQCFS